MPLHITNRDIEEAHRYARDAMSTLRGVGRADGALSRTTKSLVNGGVVCLGAAAVGALSGKFGSADINIGGKSIPLDLLSGLAGKAAAVFMEDGTASEQLDNFSTGVLAAFVTKYTIGVGKAWSEEKKSAAPAIAGSPAPRSLPSAPPPLTESELAKMAQAIR